MSIKQFSNKLTKAEAERLACLAEELAEAIQAVGKILRHGYESVDPTKPLHEQITNRRWLEQELGDVWAIQNMMLDAKDINLTMVEAHVLKKRNKVKHYLHHQGPL